MPSKSAAKPTVTKETSANESTRTARKAPRVSTAKHRATKSQEVPSGIESNSVISVEENRETIRETVAAIAYGYWQSRGCQGGDPMEDWVRAEQEFQSRKTMAATA